MKTNCWKSTLFAALVCAMLFAVLPCAAAEEGEDDWWQDSPRLGRGRGGPELTEERIERIMDWIRQANPKHAKELEKLRRENPEQFKMELREIVRERMRRHQMRPPEGGRGRPRPGHGPPPAPHAGPGPGPEGVGGWRGGGGWGRVSDDEYLEWLQQNHPERASMLSELKERDPELYERFLRLGHARHGRIARLEKENPELAGVLKEKMELNEQRNRVVRELRTATDENAKKALEKELKGILETKFDIIVRERRLEYENLKRKLERLQKEVEAREAEVGKWKDPDFKKTKVQQRMEALLEGAQEFRWD